MVSAQCNWTQIYLESYEYTTTIPYLIPGKVYHDTPQTTALANCVRTGTRGLYMNIIDNETGLIYSQPFTDICVGQSYRFGFSFRNASGVLVNPNMTFNVINGNNVTVSTLTVVATNAWQDLTMPQFTATTNNLRFEIVTNIPGGGGNDAGFDDLKLFQCQPVPNNISLTQCAGSTGFNLFNSITNPLLSNTGVWTGASALQNGYQGTFTPGTNAAGNYTYTIDGAAGCADSVAIVNVQLTQTPSLTPVSPVSACGSYTLPAITGTNLSGNEKYYTGPGATGTVLAVGSAVTTSQTIYIYGGAPGCSDETSFAVTISTAGNAGNDNGANYCGPGAAINLNTFKSSNASTNGVWAETTTPPSGTFNPATGIFASSGVPSGTYTFTYTVPANGACPADQAVFTVGIGNFPQVNLGPDTTLCQGQSILLNAAATGPYASYLWNNSSTGPTRLVTSSGTYSVRVSTLGDNQIVNGDFEQGTAGFTTAYTPGTGGTYGLLTNEGTYAITTSPNLVHNNFYTCNDHTPAPGTRMMVVNGASSPNVKVWCQTVPIQPNTNYQFGTWVTSMENTSTANLAQLQFSINNTPFGTVYTPSTLGCNWGQFTQNWFSGMTTSAEICVVSQNFNNPGGNDFALDDITFRPICYSYDTVVVTIAPLPVVNLGADINDCAGDTITLDAQNPGASYLWSDGSTLQTLEVTASGTYSVTVTTPAHCTGSDNINIHLEVPKSAGSDNQDIFCITTGSTDLNDLLSTDADAGGQWFDFDNTMSGGLNANGNLNFSALTGVHQAAYVVSGTYCPNDTSLMDITIYDQPVAGADNSTHLCNAAGDQTDLNALVFPINAPLAAYWEELSVAPSGQFDPATGILDVSDLAAGNYIFSYILPADQPCLADTATVNVKITEIPQVQFSADKIKGCLPVEVTFTNESNTAPGSVYLWEAGDGTTSADQLTFTNLYESVNCFDVKLTVTADNLCTSTVTKSDMICVDPIPVASFHYSPQQVFSDGPLIQFENTSTLNDFNEWTFGDGGTSNLLNPEHQYPLGEIGNYLPMLIVTTNAGCKDTAYQTIIVRDQVLFYVPNTFTPDGNEFNNIFIPVMTAGFDPADYEMKIYNRWGELIFLTKDIAIGWDGTYQGQLMKNDIYIWTLEFGAMETDERFVRQGHVNLMR